VRIDAVLEEADRIAKEHNLKFIEVDRTDYIVSLKLLIDNELFIQVYCNAMKDKLNITLVFKKKRLYGYDSEGGRYHCHPFDSPDEHIFIDEKKSLRDFVRDSMKFLEQEGLL
jgi:hypothetical protein